MNINTTVTDAYEPHKNSLAEKNDESFDSEQRVVKSFSRKRLVEDKSSAPIKQMREFGCIVPDCSHQMVNQPIPDRKVSHCFNSDGCEGIDEVKSRPSEIFSADEVAKCFRNTIKKLIHTLRYEKIARESYEDDQRDELTEIFIDFILYREGLVHDRCFTVESSTDKYVAGKIISQKRVEEIQSFLNAIFTERAAAEPKRNRSRLFYSLGDILVDYLNKRENVPNDVIPNVRFFLMNKNEFTYEKLLKDIFPFFQTLLPSGGLFSELVIIFNFAVKFRQKIIDSGSLLFYPSNLLTIALRINKIDMREFFNRHVMDVIFFRRCDGIVDTLFDGCPLSTENEAKSENKLNPKFGEELEYDVKNVISDSEGKLVSIFSSRFAEKELTNHVTAKKFDSRCGFDSNFTLFPFYDTRKWFEIICTPYHADDQLAELSFEKVIEVTDSMRKDGLIDYSSGHKHVDVLSATQGDTSVLLALESEIQRNPFLLRAFGNNDRILQNDEAKWYKTFADYNPDTKLFAVKRLNWIIDRYNKKIEEGCTEESSYKSKNDSEKKDRLNQFVHFYNQLVHMTTIQRGLGGVGDDYMEKYMAISLLHITGASKVKKLSTLEFRFFRCPKTVQEIKLINQFLHALFQYIHQCRKDKIPLQPVPENI
ncbi:hypothetical protein, partial [Endozoicomonas sp. SESOKO3]|uniref:hypothetical protein n=1 Tax=Endozoicomonas sp. SESOKO3 TaxID=2828744 RepID=UPI0021483AC5